MGVYAMPKTPKSTLDAISRYNAKSKYIKLKYTQYQINEHERIVKYCDNNGLSLQGYIKSLIKSDLDAKGIPYPVDNTTDNTPD